MQKPSHRVFSLVFLICLSIPTAANSQSTTGIPTVLNQTMQRLGGSPPDDAVIDASVTITAGSTQETGTLRIATKNTTHTSETYDTPTMAHHVVFAAGIASESKGRSKLKELPFGRTLTAQSALSPLTFLASKMTDKSLHVDDLGLQNVDGSPTRQLQISNSWANDKALSPYQEFTVCDIWLDPVTALPRAVSYRQREGIGAIPWVAIRVEYEDYRAVGGLLYPYHITKYVNGTKWADINVTSVATNKGLVISEFATK